MRLQYLPANPAYRLIRHIHLKRIDLRAFIAEAKELLAHFLDIFRDCLGLHDARDGSLMMSGFSCNLPDGIPRDELRLDSLLLW